MSAVQTLDAPWPNGDPEFERLQLKLSMLRSRERNPALSPLERKLITIDANLIYDQIVDFPRVHPSAERSAS